MGKRIPAELRFWPKVDKDGPDGCWLWTAGLFKKDGYGQFQVDGRPVGAHRYAYELLVGPIPEGLTLDHLCRVRRCVRPSHMEPVTVQENLRRGQGYSARAARVTQCPSGHPYDEENTYWWDGRRWCRACRRRRGRDSWRRRHGKGNWIDRGA